MMANSIWRHCHRPCRRKAGGPAKGGPADPPPPWRELPWDKLRLSAVCPDYCAATDEGAAGATDDGAGSTSQVKPSNAQPEASWRRWTSRAKACVDRLQHQQHGLKRRSA
jgi:hypothetical protein